MTNHREMLELAAVAYADPDVGASVGCIVRMVGWNEDIDCGVFVEWNPLEDDGDALRLAVKLCGHGFAMVDLDIPIIQARIDGADMQSAARLAIVKAAAEIGKGMLG